MSAVAAQRASLVRRALPTYLALLFAILTVVGLLMLRELSHVLLILFVSILFAAALSGPRSGSNGSAAHGRDRGTRRRPARRPPLAAVRALPRRPRRPRDLDAAGHEPRASVRLRALARPPDRSRARGLAARQDVVADRPLPAREGDRDGDRRRAD